MTASRLGLAVLALVAAVLAVVVAAGGGRGGVVDRRLAPELDVDRITEIRLGGATLVRGAHGWERDGMPVDANAIDAMFAALRGGRWHRQAPALALDAPRRVVTFVTPERTVAFRIDAALAGSGQTWLARDKDAVLVDDWIAKALAPEPVDLVDRHPLAGVTAAPEIRLGAAGVVLHGHPRQLAAPQSLWPAPALVQALESACAQLEVVALPAKGTPPPGEPAIAFGQGSAREAGPCPGNERLRLVVAASGAGCVDAARWQAVADAIAAFAKPPEQLVDRRPLPVPAKQLVFGHAATLELAGRPRIDGHDADPERVGELVAALTAPAEVVAMPAMKPSSTIVAGDITLDLYDHVLARRGEPVALRPSPEAWAILTRPASALRDPTRWLEDPASISTITVDGVAHRRGSTMGEWTAARDPALVEALASALAAMRAPVGPAPARIAHRIELAITPPAGAPVTHRLEIGDGCAARVDGDPVALPLAACTAIAAAAASP